MKIFNGCATSEIVCTPDDSISTANSYKFSGKEIKKVLEKNNGSPFNKYKELFEIANVRS
jgi:hypothetical protein